VYFWRFFASSVRTKKKPLLTNLYQLEVAVDACDTLPLPSKVMCMVYTKKYFVEITTLEPTTDDLVYLSLTKNIPNSFIQIFVADERLNYIKDVKK